MSNKKNGKLRFTQEQIEKANNSNIFDYANTQGFELKKVGVNSYHIKGYGGLYINPLENKWNCFSKNKGGGPIQFVMFMENKTWVQSIKKLLGMSIGVQKNTYNPISKNNSQVIKNNKGKVVLPKKNNTYSHMIAYLIKTRKIDKEIVYKLIKDKKLYEDKNRNCVFVGYDAKKNPRYANKRSTNISVTYKGEALNSDKSFPFLFGKGDKKVFVFESAIDAMSHATIFKMKGLNWINQYRLSLGGLSEKGLDKFLNDNKNVTDITLCLDNDKAGCDTKQKLLKKYKDKGYKVNFYNMVHKDINDELKFILKYYSHLKYFTSEIEYEDELEL